MFKKLISNKISTSLLEKKYIILGGIFLVISLILLFGAITYTLAALFVIRNGLDSTIATMLAFWIIFIITTISGVLLVVNK